MVKFLLRIQLNLSRWSIEVPDEGNKSDETHFSYGSFEPCWLCIILKTLLLRKHFPTLNPFKRSRITVILRDQRDLPLF